MATPNIHLLETIDFVDGKKLIFDSWSRAIPLASISEVLLAEHRLDIGNPDDIRRVFIDGVLGRVSVRVYNEGAKIPKG